MVVVNSEFYCKCHVFGGNEFVSAKYWTGEKANFSFNKKNICTFPLKFHIGNHIAIHIDIY